LASLKEKGGMKGGEEGRKEGDLSKGYWFYYPVGHEPVLYLT
jgi:hypothetical protein